MKRLELIQTKFPNKQINRLVCFRNTCTLSFHDRIVFSFLHFRCRREGVHIYVSIRKLSKLSGLHRDTVSKSLRKLLGYRLAQQRDGMFAVHFLGLKDNPDWFAFRGGRREPKDLAYHYFPQPSPDSPFSILDSLVYLTDLIQPGLSTGLVAARFKVSWATVKKSRSKVSELDFSTDWFKEVEFKKKPKQDCAVRSFLDNFKDGSEKALVRKFQSFNFSQPDILTFFEKFRTKIRDEENYYNFIYLLLGTGKSSFDSLMTQFSGRGNAFAFFMSRLRF